MSQIKLAPTAKHYQQNALEIAAHKSALQSFGCKSPVLSCSRNIMLGLFFDGTGNNRDNDWPQAKNNQQNYQTNVVRLYYLHPNDQTKGVYSVYIPGVGTPFKDISDSGKGTEGIFGAAMGWRGASRVNYAFIALLNSISTHLIGNDVLNYNQLAKEAAAGHKQSATQPFTIAGGNKDALAGPFNHLFTSPTLKILQNRLLQHIPTAKRQSLGTINVSIFGFSRGAAEARAFIRHFSTHFPSGIVAGFKVKLFFAGLFDTVASVGLVDLLNTKQKIMDGHYDWAKNLTITSNMVEKCHHYIALHEVRGCFPLDSMEHRVGGKPQDFMEIAYPGAHSDVGGGYGNAQGKTDVSVVTGLHMYYVARAAGVPLIQLNQTTGQYAKSAVAKFQLSPRIVADFERFRYEIAELAGRQLLKFDEGTASRKKLVKAAMDSYFTHRGVILDRFRQQSFFQKSNAKDQKWLTTINNHLIHRVLYEGETKIPDITQYLAPTEAVQIVKEASAAKNLREAGITNGLNNFYSDYVHDSVASFIGMGINEALFNQMGVAKYRVIHHR